LGKPIDTELADTWGYTYNGIYSVYLVDGNERYRNAVRNVLENVKYYRRYKWEGNSTDGYADAIEGALNLYNREQVDVAANWLDSEIQIMWGKQDLHLTKTFLEWSFRGIIEGWHGDGNFARTSIMYSLWKSQGTWVEPWEKSIVLGAEPYDQGIIIAISSKRPWKGKINFDVARHSEKLQMPIDYPRINQFPEWFCIVRDKSYEWIDLSDQSNKILSGEALLDGFTLELNKREPKYFLVRPEIL